MSTSTKSTTKATKPKKPSAHPTYAEMITSAITTMKERAGSSRQGITKYVCANYEVDADKAALYINRALKKGLEKDVFKTARETGKGAGRYRLVKKEKPVKTKRPVAKKSSSKSVKRSSKPAAKKSSKMAKPVAKKSSKMAKPAAKKSSKMAKPVAKKSSKMAKPAAKKSTKVMSAGKKTSKKA